VGAVLVRDLGDDLAVQEHRGDGVEPVEDNLVALGRGELGGSHGQGGPVRPVDETDPGEQRLVEVEVGVGDQPGGQQVEVDDAGHAGRHRCNARERGREVLGHRPGGCAHRPPLGDRPPHHAHAHQTEAPVSRSSAAR